MMDECRRTDPDEMLAEISDMHDLGKLVSRLPDGVILHVDFNGKAGEEESDDG